VNFHQKDGLGVEFIACEIELLPKGALTTPALFDAYRSVAAHA